MPSLTTVTRGLIHPGILGTAPSHEVLKTWNEREAQLISECSHMDKVVALPPEPKNVHVGASGGDLKENVGKEGARTVPGRPEHGGNCDIKNLSRGSKVFLPVHVKGAKFSVGDLHFSQGDGEISFCGAIEMAGVITIKFSVMKGGVAELGMKSPLFIPGPVEPQFGPGRHLYFEGFSVDEHGKQHYLDATVAYRQTCLRIIEYLQRYGYSPYQIYLLLSCAPIQGHIAGIVDVSQFDLPTQPIADVSGTECLHHDWSAYGYLRLRYQSTCEGLEEGHGKLCFGELIVGVDVRISIILELIEAIPVSSSCTHITSGATPSTSTRLQYNSHLAYDLS